MNATESSLDAAIRTALRQVMHPNRDPAVVDTLPPNAPTDLRTVFAALAGTTIEPDDAQPIDIFDVDEMRDVRGQTGYAEALPSAIFFASDGGDGWFYVDTDGSIGGTAGAVLWGDRCAMRRETSVRVAPDLAGFLVAAANGKAYPNVDAPSIAHESGSITSR